MPPNPLNRLRLSLPWPRLNVTVWVPQFLSLSSKRPYRRGDFFSSSYVHVADQTPSMGVAAAGLEEEVDCPALPRKLMLASMSANDALFAAVSCCSASNLVRSQMRRTLSSNCTTARRRLRSGCSPKQSSGASSICGIRGIHPDPDPSFHSGSLPVGHRLSPAPCP